MELGLSQRIRFTAGKLLRRANAIKLEHMMESTWEMSSSQGFIRTVNLDEEAGSGSHHGGCGF